MTVQRAIETLGIPTLVITVEPEESRQARPPRALSPTFRESTEPGFGGGRTFGRPNDPELHKRILRDALAILSDKGEPGRIETRAY